jgi:hypothetical protein
MIFTAVEMGRYGYGGNIRALRHVNDSKSHLASVASGITTKIKFNHAAARRTPNSAAGKNRWVFQVGIKEWAIRK